jgi:hypothetical protein
MADHALDAVGAQPGALRRKNMDKLRSNNLLARAGQALAVTLLVASGTALADNCSYKPAEVYEIAKENGFDFSCAFFYEESNTAAESDYKVFDDGSIGCSGKTPNQLGMAWIYMNFFNREGGGLNKGWQLWNYDVTGLPHTRIGVDAPIRVITTTLGPNAKYEIRITNMTISNAFRKCGNALQEAFH